MTSRLRESDMKGNRSTTRRAYLRAGGATLAAAALAGCGGWPPDDPPEETTTSTTETTHGPETDRTTTPDDSTTTDDGPGETTTEAVDEDQFETVVNVADAGADTSGEDAINPVLSDHLADDTLLKFPEGRYRLDPWEVVDYRNLGMVGENAALVPPEGERGYWLMFGKLRNFAFEGFTLDCRETGVAPVNHISVNGGSNVVRDVSLRGHRRVPKTGFEIAAADPSAEFLFENVELPDGSTGGNAIYVFPKSVGKLTVRDCYVEHWAEGLYAAYHSGPLRVLGGYYANNGIDQVRVGGGHRGALVRGVTVRVDNPKRPEAKPNMRGIWLEEGGRARVENCDIAITDLTGTYSSGAIVVGYQFGTATIENTRIRTDAVAPAINIRHSIDSLKGQFAPSLNRLPDEWPVTCRNVRISGEASSGRTVLTDRRDDCLFDGVCIQHPNGSRDGFEISNAEGCAVRDSVIAVGGDAITTEGATVVTNGVREDGSC
jgi:uncharacterized protein (DUF433 family)